MAKSILGVKVETGSGMQEIEGRTVLMEKTSEQVGILFMDDADAP